VQQHSPQPGYGPMRPQPQPYPGPRPQPQPQPYPGPQPYAPPGAKKTSSTKRLLGVFAAVVLALVALGAISSALQNDTKKTGQGTGSGTNEAGGSGGSGGSKDSSPSSGAPAPDPKPVEYKNVSLANYFGLSLSDEPVRPKQSDSDLKNGGVGLTTDTGQLILLKGAQSSTLETCRTDTRYTTYVSKDKLSRGSRLCLLTDAGDVALIKIVGFPDETDASSYMALDLTVWRHAMDVEEG
jgi:hypothetical protein